MKSWTRIILYALLSIPLLMVLSVPGLGQSFCGTQEAYTKSYFDKHGKDVPCQVGECDYAEFRDQWIPGSPYPATRIRLVFNIFCDDNGENCVRTQQQIDSQVIFLNYAYAQAAIHFEYHTRFISDGSYMYDNCPDDDMKDKYAFFPDMFLNVYVGWHCPDCGDFSLATYPWEADAVESRGGIILCPLHFYPGRSNVLTHEIGHCLGLYHTFRGVEEVPACGDCFEEPGSNCGGSPSYPNGNEVGDLCCDTKPYPSTRKIDNPGWCSCPETSNCPEAYHTDTVCTFHKWPTDAYLGNYMTYAGDACWDNFTEQQAGRIHCWYNHPNGIGGRWSPGYNNTYYVPFDSPTIQNAIDGADDGDTVVVFPGVYPGNLDFKGKGVVVRSLYGPDSTVIEAQGAVPAVKFISGEPPGAEISGFTITGSSLAAILCSGSSPTIRNNIIVGNSSNNYGSAITLQYTSGSLVENNIIVSDTGLGIRFGSIIFINQGVQDTIRYNLLYNCHAENAIRCFGTTAHLINNTIDGSSIQYGVRSQGGMLGEPMVYCRNNIIMNVSRYGVFTSENGLAAVLFNDIWNCQLGDLAGTAIITDSNNINADPKLDLGYRLEASSPCINAGDPDPAFNDPDGTRNDMGVFYYHLRTIYIPDHYTSIQEAINFASDGETIWVRPGTYNENIDFLGKTLTVSSTDGADATVIDVSGVNPSAPAVQLISGEPKSTLLQGFTIQGSHNCGILCAGSSPNIKENVIQNNTGSTASVGAGLHLIGTEGALLGKNIIRHDTAQSGGAIIWIEDGLQDTVCHNLVYGCGYGHGLRLENSSAVVYNNTIDSSAGHGIYALESSSGDCRNNIIVNSGGYAINAPTFQPNSILVEYNDMYNNFLGEVEGAGILLGVGNLVPAQDPSFNMPADQMQYTLSENSPCMDAGDPADSYLDDCPEQDANNPRNDMGWRPCCECPSNSGPQPKSLEKPAISKELLSYNLSQNYPNPFNPGTRIGFDLPAAANVKIEIFNILGQKVVTLLDEYLEAGSHSVEWDGSKYASGIYLYRMSTKDFNQIRKMVLLK